MKQQSNSNSSHKMDQCEFSNCHYRETCNEFPEENAPVFRKKAWPIGERVLTVQFRDVKSTREAENEIIKKGLPRGLQCNPYVFLEIKDTRYHRTVSAWVLWGELSSAYAVVEGKRRWQQIASSGQPFAAGLVTVINTQRWVKNPIEMFELYQYVSTDNDGLMTYRKVLPNGEFDDVNPDEFYIKPLAEGDAINEKFEYCYDLNSIEENSEGVKGACTTVTYRQRDKKGNDNRMPWQIRISNYVLKVVEQRIKKTDVSGSYVEVTDKQFHEIVEFIDQEWLKYYKYSKAKRDYGFIEKE